MQKKTKSSTVFVLYESDKQQEAQDAFGEVLSKVGPFVENGNVMLNEHLLERILKVNTICFVIIYNDYSDGGVTTTQV